MVVSFSPGSLMIPKFSLLVRVTLWRLILCYTVVKEVINYLLTYFFLITIPFHPSKDLVGRALVF